MPDSADQDSTPSRPRFVATIRERHRDSSQGQEVEATVTDLGEAGMFIEMQSPPPKGTILEVQFEVPGVRGRKKLLGIVRWREKAGSHAGVGVRLAPIGETERTHFAELMRRTSEDA